MTQPIRRLQAVGSVAPRLKVADCPDRCGACHLRHSAICQTMRAERAIAEQPARPLKLDRNQPLRSDLGSSGAMAVLKSGYLRFERMGHDGRRIVLGLALPGDLVGSWSGIAPSFEIEAASDSELCVISARSVRTLFEQSDAFRTQVMRETARQHCRQLDLVCQRGALSSRERLISFLLEAIDTMPTKHMADGSVVVKIEISRRDWADLANTSLETISRTLSDLSRQGLVRSVSPGTFRIQDPALLSTFAGVDSPGAVHDRVKTGTRKG